jgi:hypothetical protein
MTTHGAATFVMEKKRPEIRIRRTGFGDYCAIHIRMSPGFPHASRPEVIKLIPEIVTFFQDGLSRHPGIPIQQDPQRFTTCMHIKDRNMFPVSRWSPVQVFEFFIHVFFRRGFRK